MRLLIVFRSIGPELPSIKSNLFDLVSFSIRHVPVIFVQLVFFPDVAIFVSVSLTTPQLICVGGKSFAATPSGSRRFCGVFLISGMDCVLVLGGCLLETWGQTGRSPVLAN